MRAIIDLRGVCVDRGGGRLAVRDADLAIEPGQFVALVGPSGSGKTSLLKTINRLVEPSAGVVRGRGRDVRGTLRLTICGAASAMCSRTSACFRT